MKGRSGLRSDNRALGAKVELRVDWLDGAGLNEIRVLDAYGGEGHIWAEVQKLRPGVKVWRTGIEKVKGKGASSSTLYGDNMRYLPSMDLVAFDVVDLDAYGWPVEQIAVVADRAPEKHVFVTCGFCKIGQVPDVVLAAAGIPKEWNRSVPSLLIQSAEEFWDNFLASLGYERTIRVKADVGLVDVMMYEHLFPIATPENVG